LSLKGGKKKGYLQKTACFSSGEEERSRRQRLIGEETTTEKKKAPAKRQKVEVRRRRAWEIDKGTPNAAKTRGTGYLPAEGDRLKVQS